EPLRALEPALRERRDRRWGHRRNGRRDLTGDLTGDLARAVSGASGGLAVAAAPAVRVGRPRPDVDHMLTFFATEFEQLAVGARILHHVPRAALLAHELHCLPSIGPARRNESSAARNLTSARPLAGLVTDG